MYIVDALIANQYVVRMHSLENFPRLADIKSPSSFIVQARGECALLGPPESELVPPQFLSSFAPS